MQVMPGLGLNLFFIIWERGTVCAEDPELTQAKNVQRSEQSRRGKGREVSETCKQECFLFSTVEKKRLQRQKAAKTE